MRGVRARLTITLVALVALTAAVLGIGSYLFVDGSLHRQAVDDAAAQARFDLSVLIPNRLATPKPTLADLTRSGLAQAFQGRGVETIVDFGDRDPFVSRLDLTNGLASLGDLRTQVAAGQLGYQWATLPSGPELVIGGRLGAAGPSFYFVHDAAPIERLLGQLRLSLAVGAIALALVALFAARIVARGVLAPVEAASRAAERIERGDFSARVPVTSRDEFGTWADRFNRMAAALDDTIGRLRASQAQNRQFVADVSHELRTPLAALVAEASILRDHLDALPPEARRAGELLVGDVARLRILVDDLMEVSRFDAAAEQVDARPVDLGRLVETVTAARLPAARLDLPPDPVVVATDSRRLERILGNLLDNAREHAPGAPVEVTLRAWNDIVVLTVSDRGPGVPPERLASIFERFYKADPSRHGGSSGLGLAIASEHVALLGGTLRASNRPDDGLQMEVILPVAQPLRTGDPTAIQPDEASRRTSPAREPSS
jgi:two-component system sensor histidine kinase MtrB